MKQIWVDNNYGSELDEIKNFKKFRNLPSFTIVRNPIERVVSAWREKVGPLASGDSLSEKVMFFDKMGKEIIQKYRLGNSDSTASLDMAPVTLEEMLKYIDGIKDLVNLDGHFRPLTFNAECAICSYPYQYIIQLENINEELPFVLRQILGHDHFALPQTPPDKHSKVELTKFLNQTSPDIIFKVFSTIYRNDFEVFGYHLPKSNENLE